MGEQVKKILIVEDEKPMARALELKLSNSGFTTQVAFNGEEALRLIDQEEFDLILLDLIMPKVDGFAILSVLHDKQMQTPVIVLSNLGQEEDVKKAREMGAKDYFVKSDTPITTIVERVQTFLAQTT